MGNGHVTFTTSDPDEARDTLTRLYLPLELLPERGELAMRLDATAHTALTIGLISFGPRIRVRCPPNAHYHVVLPLAGRARYHSGDGPAVVSEPGMATVFAPEAPAELDWAPGTEQLCVMLDGREVERELRQLLGHDVGPRLAFAARMDLSRGPARTWVEALMLLTRAARQESELLSHPLAARRLEQIVFDALLTGQPHNYSDQLTTGAASPGRSAVRCAVDLVQAYPDREWTTGRLAAAVSVSARADQRVPRGDRDDSDGVSAERAPGPGAPGPAGHGPVPDDRHARREPLGIHPPGPVRGRIPGTVRGAAVPHAPAPHVVSGLATRPGRPGAAAARGSRHRAAVPYGGSSRTRLAAPGGGLQHRQPHAVGSAPRARMVHAAVAAAPGPRTPAATPSRWAPSASRRTHGTTTHADRRTTARKPTARRLHLPVAIIGATDSAPQHK
ncbi:helix-turn-helix domain-containing protein [Amycolatopsis methanolica 239]|uniref:Helix-turn-helix domain-containing protein n=1 Tax=Amycolatopsis methanolica 239 TaxID=1068978 RepID=A0A076N110_AMYME|nr:hypothetical protein [Amycolatopsis methanolica]AIJ24535.1 helix-turn-helix domain-containing protein [Amycolatopsis methanolica 239]